MERKCFGNGAMKYELTGDMTALWIGMIVVAAVGLCVVNVYAKKRQKNAF